MLLPIQISSTQIYTIANQWSESDLDENVEYMYQQESEQWW